MNDAERKARERHPAGKGLVKQCNADIPPNGRFKCDKVMGHEGVHSMAIGLVQSKMGEQENYSLTIDEFTKYVNDSFSDIVRKLDTAEKQSLYIQLLQREIRWAAIG